MKRLRTTSQRTSPSAGSEIYTNIAPFEALSEPSSFIHKCFIQGTFVTPEDFIKCIDVISSAKSGECVVIYLTSDGGSLDAVDCLLMEIDNAKQRGVRIIVEGSGVIASAATLVLLEATEFTLSKSANILLHSAAFGYGGKSQDIKEYVDFIVPRLRELLEDYYSDLLTPEEIDDMIINKREIWMSAETFTKRFMDAQESRQERMMEEVNKAMEKHAIPSKEKLLSCKTKKDIVNMLEEIGLWDEEDSPLQDE